MRALDLIESWDAGAVAIGVIGRDGILATRGDLHRRFELASVTKLFSCWAVLRACEEGAVSLDDAAGPPGATLAHLLAHASGLGFDDATRPLARPGTRRIYSNAGIEVAAEHTAARDGMTFSDHLGGALFGPLDMGDTSLEGSPAHGATSSLRDLLAFAAELLAPRTLGDAMARRARSVAFPGLVGVVPGFGRFDPCDWGLGPELHGHKSPHWMPNAASPSTFGHFGRSGSFLWVDPEASLACAALCERPFGPWAVEAWPVLGDAVLAEAVPTRAGPRPSARGTV